MTITFEFFLFFTRNVVLHSTPNIVVRDEGVYFQMEGGRAEDEGHRAALSQGSILSSSRNLRCQELFRLSWKWTFKLFALRGYGERCYLPLG